MATLPLHHKTSSRTRMKSDTPETTQTTHIHLRAKRITEVFQGHKSENTLLEPANEMNIRPREADRGEILPPITRAGYLWLMTFESDI